MPPAPSAQTIRNTTQHHLDIEEITDDIVILKDGAGCLILKASAINFNLLSEEEQEAIIYAYAAILNSLTYPIQILIQSERKDISDYLQNTKRHEDTQNNKVVKEQIRKYRRFVEETVQRNNVLDKKFYIIIPFTSIELGAPTAFMSQLKGERKLPFPMSFIVEQAKNHLHPKRDHLIRQFTRLGIRLTQLSTPEIIELFYRAYNPDYSYGQQLATALNYSSPVVEGPPEISRSVNQFLKDLPNDNRLQTPTQSSTPPATNPPQPTPPQTADMPPQIQNQTPPPYQPNPPVQSPAPPQYQQNLPPQSAPPVINQPPQTPPAMQPQSNPQFNPAANDQQPVATPPAYQPAPPPTTPPLPADPQTQYNNQVQPTPVATNPLPQYTNQAPAAVPIKDTTPQAIQPPIQALPQS